MAANLGTLTLDLVAKIGGFTGPMDKAGRQAKKTSTDIAKASKAMGVAIGTAAGAAAAGVAIAVVAMVNTSRKAIDEQAKLAAALGGTSAGMDALARAGGRAGVTTEEMRAAATRLNQTLGKAIAEGGKSAEVFERLGLSAVELSKMDVDQRFAAIANRMKEMGLSTQLAAAELRSMGIRQSSMITLMQGGGSAIEESRKKLELYGVTLSDIDAAQVESMNDAFEELSIISTGFSKQLTVQLAPAIEAVSQILADATIEVGGVGNAAEWAFNKTISAAAFVVDAVDGVKRAFELTADGIIFVMGKAISFVTNNAAGMLSAISMLPGIDYSESVSSLRDFAVEANGIAGEAAANIDETLSRPLAGTAFKDLVDQVRETSRAAAELAVNGRKAGDVIFDAQHKAKKETKKVRDAIGEQIKALQFQAETVGMSADKTTLLKLRMDGATESQLALASAALKTVTAYEAQTKALKDAQEAQETTNKEAMSILDSLLTDEESIRKSYERRRQIILDNTAVTGEAQTELLRRLEEKRNEDLLEINGTYWEKYLAAAEEALTSFDELAGNTVENFSSRFGDAFESMIFDAQTLEESVVQMAEGMARSIVNALGQMAAQWLAYQVVQMMVGKTTQASAATTIAANASAMSVAAGINAFASAAAIPIVGWAAAPGAMAAALAITAPMAVAAGSLAMAGMAHDGIDSIPKTGTWLLEKGERVTTAGTSAKLDATLDRVQSGMSSGGGSQRPINIVVNQPGITDARQARQSEASTRRAIARGVAQSGRYT